jgi:hypothetical protein
MPMTPLCGFLSGLDALRLLDSVFWFWFILGYEKLLRIRSSIGFYAVAELC